MMDPIQAMVVRAFLLYVLIIAGGVGALRTTVQVMRCWP